MTGQTVDAISEDGMKTRCMAMETSSGQTEDNTQELIVMIQKWALGYSDGQMVEGTKECGTKGNNMDEENLFPIMERLEKGSGRMGKDAIG